MIWPTTFYGAFNINNIFSIHIETRQFICNGYKLAGFYVNDIMNLNGHHPFNKYVFWLIEAIPIGKRNFSALI